VGYPLLRRYGMKGIVFLVPGRMSAGGGRGPTLDEADAEAEAGSGRNRAALDRERGAGPFLTWAEVEAMAASGLFDFESHSLTHARIHTGPRVVGFLTPALQRGYAAFDAPLVAAQGRDLLAPDAPLGTPLLASDSRLSESLRFHEDEEGRRPCIEAVEAGGGAGFFAKRGWEVELRRLAAARRVTGRYESPADRAAAIAGELRESKRLIEEHTGRPVTHLCYPWHVAGPTARRLAAEAGYRTAFCGKVPGVPVSRAGSDPLRIARLGEDYVELLPGRGRERLATVLQRKWTRRRRGTP
jgi:peptidoglycan/xylan/chitin deacetylase (PgdA/CDA1 family)